MNLDLHRGIVVLAPRRILKIRWRKEESVGARWVSSLDFYPSYSGYCLFLSPDTFGLRPDDVVIVNLAPARQHILKFSYQLMVLREELVSEMKGRTGVGSLGPCHLLPFLPVSSLVGHFSFADRHWSFQYFRGCGGGAGTY